MTATVNATSASQQAYPAPVLLSPGNWEAIGDKHADVILEWESVGALGPSDHYLVRISTDHPGLNDLGTEVSLLTQEVRLQCDKLGEMYACWTGSAYGARFGYASHWSVSVVRVGEGGLMEELSPSSETRSFVWRTP
jgi:hypothetical protein